jgi:phage terminase large subunit-like protein
VKAGPKAAVTAAPLDLSMLPRSGGARIVAFIHRFLLTPKGHGAREPMRLRPFQREIVHGLYRPGVRQGLVAMPRGNGKTTLAAAIALADLFAGGEGGRAYCCAADERQARLGLSSSRS